MNIWPEPCWQPYFQPTEQIRQLYTCPPSDIQKRRFAVSSRHPHSTTWAPYYDSISDFFFYTPPHAVLPSWARRELVLTGCSCHSLAVKLPSLPSRSPSLSPWATADNTRSLESGSQLQQRAFSQWRHYAPQQMGFLQVAYCAKTLNLTQRILVSEV